ncbi:hypothetical protein EW145_g6381 [Phellinidium pouzarii]|uniref:Uncharacterized protein n=1 Tax=Phellinidium pouzarii TaxID=167371 RepID=A0A4S4L1G3_9AGAM|nr:hypothetical protein EW145_g6381 [Phellinidium pouzarii]
MSSFTSSSPWLLSWFTTPVKRFPFRDLVAEKFIMFFRAGTTMDNEVCQILLGLFSFWTKAITDLITILLIDYILQMRVMALFSNDRRVSIILKTLLFMEAAAGLALLVTGNIFEEIGVASLTEGMIYCVVNRLPSPIWSPISWSIPLAYGLVLMTMALYKAAEFWKLAAGIKGLTLVGVLLQDQVMYFFIALFCSVIQIIANTTLLSAFLSVAFSVIGNPSVLCVLGSRILVHLKEAGERGAHGGTSYTLRTVSEMEFR